MDTLDTQYARATSSFHGRRVYNYVSLRAGEEIWYGELVMLFQVRVKVGAVSGMLVFSGEEHTTYPTPLVRRLCFLGPLAGRILRTCDGWRK